MKRPNNSYWVIIAATLSFQGIICDGLLFRRSFYSSCLDASSKSRIEATRNLHTPEIEVVQQANVLLRKNVELYSSIALNSSSTQFSFSSKVGNGLTKPEVLSPAGGWPQLMAACSNGADAVYFGLREGFNARARASNFDIDEVGSVMEFLHERGVKGYVVVNILVFDEEMTQLETVIRRLALAGVDALIMQDIGAVELARKVAPNLPVHGSTQMTITDSHGADFATQKLGIDRVVVGRELSIKEISSVAQKSEAEVEAFVHGALCVSYSGQCFSSEAWGGRSANRGQCAQACRMPYGLVVNGTLKDLYDVQYLLSPQDLMAVDLVPQLILAGVRSFKIEGRLKGPEYVAVTTRAYREAVDEAWELLVQRQGQSEEEIVRTYGGPDEQMRRDLKQVFSRGQDEQFDGLSAGFLLGVKHQNLVRGRNPRHRGLLVGRVIGVSSKGVQVLLSGPVKRGDGVVFDGGKPEQREQGGAVYEVFPAGTQRSEGRGEEVSAGAVTLTFGRSAVDFSRVSVGDFVWRNKDSDLEFRVQKYLQEKKRFAVEVQVTGRLGAPLAISLTCSLPDGRTFSSSAETKSVMTSALKRPTSREDISAAIGSFGGMPFTIETDESGLPVIGFADLDLSGEGQQGVFIPIAEVKEARRSATLSLQQLLRGHDRAAGLLSERDKGLGLGLPLLRTQAVEAFKSRREGNPSGTKAPGSTPGAAAEAETGVPKISVLCRTPEQVAAACEVEWLEEVVLDFLEVHGLRESVQAVRRAKKSVVVATPRIVKPDEERLFSFYLRLRPDALLVRSAGFLQQLVQMGGPGALYASGDGGGARSVESIRIPALHGDFSLNAANVLSAGLLLRSGLSRLAPTHDLDAAQISSMAKILNEFDSAGAIKDTGNLAGSLEVVLYQHLPIFHTDHCVFCRFLSTGNSYLDCGKPCEQNSVHLRALSDGQDHLVLADQGCRNTVFNAKAQNGATYASKFVASGINRFRIELVDEPANFVRPLLEKYRSVLDEAHLGKEGPAVDELGVFLETVPNRNGKPQGADEGSLQTKLEITKSNMKITAAEKSLKDKEKVRDSIDNTGRKGSRSSNNSNSMSRSSGGGSSGKSKR